MNKITLSGKEFSLLFTKKEIIKKVQYLAKGIENHYQDKEVVFISILNGSFMFTSDLLKSLQLTCRLSFIKLSSYDDDHSSGTVKELIGLEENICGKHVIVLEDIIDTGLTLDKLMKTLQSQGPASIRIAALLFKPKAYCASWKVDYIGWEIENRFVVGYGMDYKGNGRNFENIYILKQ